MDITSVHWSYWIALLILAVFGMLERFALRQWSPWAFQGICFYRRHEQIRRTGQSSVGLDVLLAQDREICNLGFATHEKGPGEFLMRLPAGRKRRFISSGFDEFATGILRYDQVNGQLEFSARFTPDIVAGWGGSILILLATGNWGPILLATMGMPFIPLVTHLNGRRLWNDFFYLVSTGLSTGTIGQEKLS